MTLQKPKRKYRFLKRFLAIAGIVLMLFFFLQYLFVRNAHIILKNYVRDQSAGKLKLELEKLDLNIFTKRLHIVNADLRSTDTVNEAVTYHVTFTELSLKVGSVWALFFDKKLLLDSLKVYNPDIQVMQWRKDSSRAIANDNLSLPQEMGKVYNTLMDALNAFEVRRIIIDNARISLVKKRMQSVEPVTVSNIFFDLARTPVKEGKSITYLKGQQTIELRSTNQYVKLGTGRHELSFKSFKLRLFRQSIELDSCTVTVLPTEKIKSNYTIFFKKLLLSGVDFEAMYARNVIKADTVYCENPYFDFNLYRTDAVAKKAKIPDADKIIRVLSGNLDLAFVGVQNAGIHFNIYGKTKRTFFNSNKDNFEVRGLRVNPDSSEPVAIRQFDMTMKDYHLYNEDSTSAFSFDKVRFFNKRIMLNDFAFLSRASNGQARNVVDIKVPYFELSDLNWYQLIFEQNMAAREAILKDPVMNFTRKKSGVAGKKLNLFEILINVDSLVRLDKVSVTNGQVNMQLGAAASFNVQNIDFVINTNAMLAAHSKEGLRNAVEQLSFSKGALRLKDMNVQLQQTSLTGDNQIYAGRVDISGLNNNLSASIQNVSIDNLQFDDNADTIEADGLKWEQATLLLKTLPAGGKRKHSNSSIILLRNIAGNNTHLNFSGGTTSITADVQKVDALLLSKKGNALHADGFDLTGNRFLIHSSKLLISADAYQIDSESSLLTGVRVQQIAGRDTLSIRSPKVIFTTSLNDLFANDLHFQKVQSTAPVLTFNKWDFAAPGSDTAGLPSRIRIDRFTSTAPDITIATHRNDSSTVVSIPGSASSYVDASGIVISDDGLQIGEIQVNATAATVLKSSGELAGIEQGNVAIDASDLMLSKKEGKLKWSGNVNNLSLQNSSEIKLGTSNRKLSFKAASLGNLNLSSDLLSGFDQLLKANIGAWLHIPEGQFIDNNTTFKWHNARYDNSNRTLSLDSLDYHPTQSLDSMIAQSTYGADYITIKSGAISMSGIDAGRYEKDSAIIVDNISIQHPDISIFHFKKPVSSPETPSKSFPVDIIQNLALPVSVQSVDLNDGTLLYAEKNSKSGMQGNFLLTNVGGRVENIKNIEISVSDTLSFNLHASLMDAADITATLTQSYTDTVHRFAWHAKIRSTDLTVFNPILVPLANIKIASGFLDSVSMWSLNNNDRAHGEMKMYYRKLRIKLIDNGNAEVSTFKQKMISFLANTFVIRNHNSNRIGIVYYKNPGHKSFINYIIKTGLSGVFSSVGIKSNRKYRKLYHKDLQNSKRKQRV